MGSKNQEQTVGYMNFLGLHAALCVSPAEGIASLEFDDRVAWKGPVGSETIQAFKPDLWGGNEREGGFVAHIDYLNGEASQARNKYLQQVLDDGQYIESRTATYDSTNPGLVPAFRNVVSFVCRRAYWGNNPYIKRLTAKVMNVYNTFDQWEPALAPVNPEYDFDNTAIVLMIDQSTAMNTSEAAIAKGAAKEFFALLGAATGTFSLKVIAHAAGNVDTFTRIPFTSSDVTAADAFIDGLGASSGTVSWQVGPNNIGTFFTDSDSQLGATDTYTAYVGAASGDDARVEDIGLTREELERVAIFVADGGGGNPTAAVSTLDSIDRLQRYGVKLTRDSDGANNFGNIQNAETGDAPWIETDVGNEAAMRLYARAFRSFEDINPVHVIRDVILNRACGGDEDDSVIDDTNFAAVATTLQTEGLGISLRWTNDQSRHEFLRLIEEHINGVVRRNRSTGLFEIELIRDDYTVGNLFTFDDVTIDEWLEYERPKPWEMPNTVTVNGTRRDNGNPLTVTLTNSAALRQTGGAIRNVDVNLPGFTYPATVNAICQRELEQRTVPIGRGRFRATYVPDGLNIGDEIIIDQTDLGIDSVVFTVDEIGEPHGADNSVILTVTEHVFQAIDAGDEFGSDDVGDGQLDSTALAATTIFFEEASYFEQVFTRGQSVIDGELENDNDLGNWIMTCDRPSPIHVSARIVLQSGSDWTVAAQAQLMPVWQLDATLDRLPTTTTFVCDVTGRENELVEGQRIQIDDEVLRLDSVVVNSGTGKATFTVGRGCLDSVPVEHAAAAKVLAWPRYIGSNLIDYTSDEVITTRILPQTIRQTLSIDDAADQTLTMASRAIRPYPVGALQVNSSYSPGAVTGTQTVSWNHRDRSGQTSEAILDHTDGDIGPETGVSYHLVRRVINDHGEGEFVSFEDETAVSPSGDDSETTDLDELNAYITAETVRLEVGCLARRDGYDNRQTPVVPITTPAQTQAAHFVGHGAIAGSNSGAITPSLPANARPGDHLTLHVMNQEPQSAPSAPAGWSQVTINSVSGHNRGVVFRRIMEEGDTAPTVASTGDTQAGIISAWRGSLADADPVEASAISKADPASTSVSIDGLTTLSDGAIVIFFLAIDDDNTGLTGLQNAGLTNFQTEYVEEYDNVFNTSEDVTLVMGWGVKDTAGAVAAATGQNTLSFAEYQVGFSVALEMP